MDLKQKLAINEYRSKAIDSGSIPEEIGIGTFQETVDVIISIADKMEMNPCEAIIGLRFWNEKPQKQITTCEFDDIQEAINYCQRMKEFHEIDCEPKQIGHHRYKIS